MIQDSEHEAGVTAKLLLAASHGDQSAREQLIAHSCRRLECLAHKMLGDFPRVRRWEDTNDVLQNASIRLMRALQDVRPETARHFYALATLQIRRSLVDLARVYQGQRGAARSLESHAAQASETQADAMQHEIVDPAPSQSRLERWTQLHETIDTLPDEEREICQLLWYQGLTQRDASEILGIPMRTLKRRWQTVRLKLHEALEGQLP